MTFISRIFVFRIIREVLNSRGWSFPWVETRHANCSFHKVVVHRIAVLFDVQTLTAIIMSLSL